jgi:hypothetical protein
VISQKHTKSELLETMRREHASWEALLAQVPCERMEEPGAEGLWSVKDIIAHVAAYEQWLALDLERALRGEMYGARELNGPRGDEINARIFRQHHDRPLAEVLAEAPAAFARLVAAVETLPESDLGNPDGAARYIDPAWLAGVPLGTCIASDSYEHYREHAPSIRAWLERVRCCEGCAA